jgi:hypothetical protein
VRSLAALLIAVSASAAAEPSQEQQLAAAYRDALRQLSVEGSKRLADGQQSWENYVTAICQADGTTDQTAHRQQCLGRAYSDRIDRLKGAVVTKGPFEFVQVTGYCAGRMADDDTGDHRGWVTHEWAYPRIERPITPSTERWNELVADKVPPQRCDDADTDTGLDYALGLVTDRLISVDWSSSFYPHGAAHGGGAISTQTIVLTPTPHALRPEDLFRPDGRWRQVLQAALLDDLREEVPADQWPLYGKFDAFVAQVAADPERWSLDENGITFSFDQYEIGPYSYSPPSFIIQWSDLRDAMVADPPIR